MKKIIVLTLSIVLATYVMSGCTDKNNSSSSESSSSSSSSSSSTPDSSKVEYNGLESIYNLKEPEKGDTIATIKTDKGDIKLVFFKDIAPKAVENFIVHSEKGYYNGVSFHRVIKDFMIQGGDPTGDGTGGESIWGSGFENETTTTAFHLRGALSMANTGAPNSNGSQFFIVQAGPIKEEDYKQLVDSGYPEEIAAIYRNKGGTYWLDGKHTVFGRVLDGMDVVDTIANIPADTNGKPDEKVLIKNIEISSFK